MLITAFILVVFNSSVSAKDPGNAVCLGKISIRGSSNVNSFELHNTVPQINILDDISRVRFGQSQFTWINIPVKNFHTSNKKIYSDFLEMVKADQHPFIKVSISNHELSKILSSSNNKVQIPAEIHLAGVSRKFILQSNLTFTPDNCIEVNGSQKLKLSEFGLVAPEKLFGLIKVNNEIIVNFAFVINTLD